MKNVEESTEVLGGFFVCFVLGLVFFSLIQAIGLSFERLSFRMLMNVD